MEPARLLAALLLASGACLGSFGAGPATLQGAVLGALEELLGISRESSGGLRGFGSRCGDVRHYEVW